MQVTFLIELVRAALGDLLLAFADWCWTYAAE